MPRRRSSPRFQSHFHVFAALVIVISLAGCAKKRPQVAQLPPPPPMETPRTARATPARPSQAQSYPENAKAIYTETGIASWYGPPYNHRKAADGQVFDMNQLTAAHK